MQLGSIYESLFIEDKKKGIFVLLDPDRTPRHGLEDLVKEITRKENVYAILVGTSLLFSPDIDDFTRRIQGCSDVPVILFPGSAMQVNRYADAILFLSLLSGRNSEYLISEQVKMAPVIKGLGIEVIPTAYLLIESNSTTAVEFISDTKPIPRNKPDIAVAHAITAEMMGMKLVYLEAGSGALNPVPVEMVREVRRNVDIPIIVGGGLRSRDQIEEILMGGADFAVVGTLIEEEDDWKLVI